MRVRVKAWEGGESTYRELWIGGSAAVGGRGRACCPRAAELGWIWRGDQCGRRRKQLVTAESAVRVGSAC